MFFWDRDVQRACGAARPRTMRPRGTALLAVVPAHLCRRICSLPAELCNPPGAFRRDARARSPPAAGASVRGVHRDSRSAAFDFGVQQIVKQPFKRQREGMFSAVTKAFRSLPAQWASLPEPARMIVIPEAAREGSRAPATLLPCATTRFGQQTSNPWALSVLDGAI